MNVPDHQPLTINLRPFMLYNILLLPARLAIHFYCRKIIINNKKMLHVQGPWLIASNHPNSFLDAIILATLFKLPVHALARGDAFKGKLITKILVSFNMLPVYRISEGVENLDNNYSTFDECRKIFEKGGIVLIFSEGRCINEWHLRPLKKGTARLALSAWQRDIPLKILPLGINYSSFRTFGKNVFLNFGNIIIKEDINADLFTGKAINVFNEKLQQHLQNLVFEIEKNDNKKLKKYFYIRQPFLKKTVLLIPAVAGYVLHFPLYYAIHLAIKNKAQDHYDSIMVGLLFFLYPLYLLIFTLIVFLITQSTISFFLLLFIPLSAISLLHFKRQIK
ncbi:MAG: 1-acyl-sn-glycerol-3-phosphate acyltransferase [Ginsengibacter sp.]